jgi:hypothetical protein
MSDCWSAFPRCSGARAVRTRRPATVAVLGDAEGRARCCSGTAWASSPVRKEYFILMRARVGRGGGLGLRGFGGPAPSELKLIKTVAAVATMFSLFCAVQHPSQAAVRPPDAAIAGLAAKHCAESVRHYQRIGKHRLRIRGQAGLDAARPQDGPGNVTRPAWAGCFGAWSGALILPGGAECRALVSAPQRPCQP